MANPYLDTTPARQAGAPAGPGGGGPLAAAGRGVARGARELREIWSSLHRIPGAVAGEVYEAARLLQPEETRSPSLRETVKKAGRSTFLLAEPPVPAEERLRTLGRARGAGEKAKAASALPIVNLIPGTFTVPRLLTREGRAELGERPVSTFLDVLPAVGKAVKVATRGGALAREAAGVTEQGGRTARAEQMVTEGLKLPEVAAQVGRRVERRIVAARPNADRILPSQMLARAQAGGATLRNFMRTLGLQDRRYAAAVAESTDEALRIGRDMGIDPSRQLEVTRLAESGVPQNLAQITPDERTWLNRLGGILDERVTRPGIAEGRLAEWAGDVWSKAGEPRVFAAAVKAQKAAARVETAIGPRRVALANKAVELADEATRLADTTPSARWKRALQPAFEDALRRVSAGASPDPARWEEVYGRLFNAGLHTQVPGLTVAEVRRVARETSASLVALKAAGHDPVYVPTLRPEDVAHLARPRLSVETVTTPAAWKARSLSQQGLHVPQAAVAVSHAAAQALERSHAAGAFDEMRQRGFVATREQVESLPQVRALAERGWDRTQVDKYVNDRWRTYSPGTPFPFGRAGVTVRKGEEFLLPRPLADALEALHRGGGGLVGGLGRALGGKVGGVAGKVFRTSVLTLSPMYMVENLVSGAVMLMARQSPVTLAYLPKALRMVMDQKVPIELTRGARQGVADQALAAYHAKAGGTLGRLLQEESAAAQRTGVAGIAARAARHPLTTLENMASAIDDSYRAATYLRAAKKTGDVEKGVEAALKVFGDFDAMTPLEKAVIRSSVVPFYGWSRFILGYVLSFPFDHPLRAAFMAGVARQQFDDWPDGLAERLKGYLFFGTPDETGRRVAVSMSGAVPMLGVANMFTVTGLLSRLGPAYSTLFQEAGVTEYGELDLHPELVWDPVSGREVARRPNVAGVLTRAYLPQAETLQMLFGETADMARLREQNPEAYRARLLSSVGIRAPRQISVAEEQAKGLRAQQRAAASQARERASVSSGGGNPYLR